MALLHQAVSQHANYSIKLFGQRKPSTMRGWSMVKLNMNISGFIGRCLTGNPWYYCLFLQFTCWWNRCLPIGRLRRLWTVQSVVRCRSRRMVEACRSDLLTGDVERSTGAQTASEILSVIDCLLNQSHMMQRILIWWIMWLICGLSNHL